MVVFGLFYAYLIVHWFLVRSISVFLKRDSNASFASLQFDSVSGFLAIRIPLYPGLISWINSFSAARIIRFALFRLTALPAEIPAVTANRESGWFTF